MFGLSTTHDTPSATLWAMASRRPIRALLFDAGYTLLEMDYGALTAQLRARGHLGTRPP